MRGKRDLPRRKQPRQGSIPACAGETTPDNWQSGRRRVYPRVCGGNIAGRAGRRGLGGLSPRVRGKRRSRPANAVSERSIPACAGETQKRIAREMLMKVYPRVCGGNFDTSANAPRISGLSPRVRGKPGRRHRRRRPRWSIPACAGETLRVSELPGPGAVYPRVCGGNGDGHTARRRVDGLSPRVRGKHPSYPAPDHPRRSIPACAGETEVYFFFLVMGEVYPRVCGGNRLDKLNRRITGGLSPRVRGKQTPA